MQSPARPIGKLHRRREIRRRPRLQNREIPLLVLEKRGNAEVSPDPEIGFHAAIVQRPAAGDELLAPPDEQVDGRDDGRV